MGWSSGEGDDKWGVGDFRVSGHDLIDLAGLPDGVRRLNLITGVSSADPLAADLEYGWLEIHKDGDYALVAASEGLGVVIRDGMVVGCRPIPQAAEAADA